MRRMKRVWGGEGEQAKEGNRPNVLFRPKNARLPTGLLQLGKCAVCVVAACNRRYDWRTTGSSALWESGRQRCEGEGRRGFYRTDRTEVRRTGNVMPVSGGEVEKKGREDEE